MKEEILQNPISQKIKESFNECKVKLNIAVPFISSYVRTILRKEKLNTLSDKKIVTRFDESSINSFDIPSLNYLLECGFDIRFNNEIHLKLYIADNCIFVTSSNFTKKGFEDNIELTVKVDFSNISKCNLVFKNLWENSELNKITKELLDENLQKYEILKKREKFKAKKQPKTHLNKQKLGSLDLQLLIDEIFQQRKNFNRDDLIHKANKLREKTKMQLLKEFKTDIFYVPEGSPKRKDNLFYDFVYGYEEKLAGTGLRELQFKTVFEHSDFKKVISYMLPETVGMESWNLDDKKVLHEFCNGIFDFNIPQYKEAIPIRLASYFYPNHIIQIFKLEHLQQICNEFGFETDAKTKGDKLYAYNTCLNKEMKAIPYENYIKSDYAYQVFYTCELYKHLKSGEDYENIKKNYKQVWKKEYIENGRTLLEKLKVLS